jgi:hypothetical protein
MSAVESPPDFKHRLSEGDFGNYTDEERVGLIFLNLTLTYLPYWNIKFTRSWL